MYGGGVGDYAEGFFQGVRKNKSVVLWRYLLLAIGSEGMLPQGKFVFESLEGGNWCRFEPLKQICEYITAVIHSCHAKGAN